MILHDFRCERGHEFEGYTAWSDTLKGLLPVWCSCGAKALLIYKSAPSIRTSDNVPRDQRLRTTGGDLKGGAIMAPIVKDGRVVGKHLVEPQTGIPIDELDRTRTNREVMSAEEFEARGYLQNPNADVPDTEFNDDPQNLKQTLDLCDQVCDQAESGTLPPVERPLTADFQKATGKSVNTVVASQVESDG